MIAYWLLIMTIIAVLGVLSLLAIWAIAKTDTFFGFVQEGQGVTIMSGDSFHKMLISFKGHYLTTRKASRSGKVPDERPDAKPGDMVDGKIFFDRLEIHEGMDPNPSKNIFGFLERSFGIYWFGIAPFKQIRNAMFNWNEWTRIDEKGNTIDHKLRHREALTKFFYVQTFNYAIELEGAETGSGKKNVVAVAGVGKETEVTKDDGEKHGGNLSVDIKITLLLRIVYPQVALFENESWFEAGEAVVLDHARLYVGSRSYEDLRAQEDVDGKKSVNEFCAYIMKLNDSAQIGAESDTFKSAFGVEIVGAQIFSVNLAGDKSGKLAEATTNLYVQQQEKLGKMELTKAAVYDITEKGNAEALAITARTRAILEFGDGGKFVARQDAIARAGEGGNTIVFTSDSEKGGLDEKALAGSILISSSFKQKDGGVRKSSQT